MNQQDNTLKNKNGMSLIRKAFMLVLLLLVWQAGHSQLATVTHATTTNESSARLIAYIPGWKTPPSATAIANAGYTHVIIAFGVFSTQRPGNITPAFNSITPSYIQSLQHLGVKVLLSLGGASSSLANTTTNFHQVLLSASSPTSFSQSFVDSINRLITTYGFDGIDFDIEQGLIGEGPFLHPTGDIAVLANIINTLRSTYPKLLLTLAPQIANIAATSGFDATWGNYAALVMQTYPSLSWVGIQMYNSGCAYGLNLMCYDPNNTNSPDASVAMATDVLESWPGTTDTGQKTGFQPYHGVLKPSQVVLGYLATNASGRSDGAPGAVPMIIKRALECLRTHQLNPNSCDTYVPPKAYPDIGGVFEWEITYDADNHYQFATSLKDCVIHKKCD